MSQLQVHWLVEHGSINALRRTTGSVVVFWPVFTCVPENDLFGGGGGPIDGKALRNTLVEGPLACTRFFWAIDVSPLVVRLCFWDKCTLTGWLETGCTINLKILWKLNTVDHSTYYQVKTITKCSLYQLHRRQSTPQFFNLFACSQKWVPVQQTE
jgi:hypothetical protein